jgi:hypothetical protein
MEQEEAKKRRMELNAEPGVSTFTGGILPVEVIEVLNVVLIKKVFVSFFEKSVHSFTAGG